MENRNDDGTFAPAELPTGRASNEADQGFRPMAEPHRDDDEAPSTPEIETERLRQFREPGFTKEDTELGYLNEDGSRADPRETISLNRAAEDAAKYHANQEQELTELKRAVVAAEVDADRAAVIDPKNAFKFGFETARPDEVKAEAPPEDRDAKISRIVEDPDVREFLETNATRAAEAAQTAELWGRSSLLAIAPELGQLPLDQWPGAIQLIAQSDPRRGEALGAVFSNVERATAAQQTIQQHQSAVREHQISEYRKAEDARFAKDTGKSPEEMTAIGQRLPGHLKALGIDPNTLAAAAARSPDVYSADFQKILARLDFLEMQNQALEKGVKAAPKNLPPVARPGTRSGPISGVHDNSSSIRALEKQLGDASGQAAIRIGAQLLAARRR